MGQFLLLVVVALTVAAVVFGVTVLLTGGDRGLSAAEPDGQAVPLPNTRPLAESDIAQVRFDTALRGYRMAQVDRAMRRTAYDIGYKDELINVLEAEVAALRSGRFSDAEVLRRAREAALAVTSSDVDTVGTGAEDQDETTVRLDADGEAPLGEHLDDRPEEPAGSTAISVEAAQPPAEGGADAAADEPEAEADAEEVEETAVEPASPDSRNPEERVEDPAGDEAGNRTDQPDSDRVLPSRR